MGAVNRVVISVLFVLALGATGVAVAQDVKADCTFGCGRVFHAGCYRARQSLADGGGCAVCGYQPA